MLLLPALIRLKTQSSVVYFPLRVWLSVQRRMYGSGEPSLIDSLRPLISFHPT